MSPRGEGAIAFAEKLLALLELGAFSATYKYALLSARGAAGLQRDAKVSSTCARRSARPSHPISLRAGPARH